MGKHIKIELLNEAVGAIRASCAITKRDPAEVVSDALRLHLWILREQALGKKVLSLNGDPEKKTELENLVVDQEAARRFFADMRW